MKKFLLFIVIMFVATAGATAGSVDAAMARKAAAGFLTSMGMKSADIRLADISAALPFTEFYVFDINEGTGFVVVAGDENTEPILAYSLDNPFPTDIMPAHVAAWLHGYELEIAHKRSLPRSAAVGREWDAVMAGRPVSDSKEVIAPILATEWDQSPYYNLLCPYDSTAGTRPPCGCTATATAQIMKAFNHPAQGCGSEEYSHPTYGILSADYGSTQYRWTSMPAKLDANSSAEQVDAVATLIYHIGVAVNMDYKIGGSAGKTASYGYGGEASSENALKYNFGYSPYIWTAFRIDYSLDDWRDLMVSELRAGHPILYAGYDEVQSGHAFVLDGYNSTTKRFHLNWGWSGSYDGNYKINELNPSEPGMVSPYNFNLFATATIGIEPYDDFDPTSTTTVVATAEGNGSVSGSGTYQFGDTIVMTATANDRATRFVRWSDGCRYNPRQTVATGGEVHFTALFAPLRSDTVRYHTCDNAMNRASNLPYGLGCDSVWGIRIPSEAIRSGAQLNAVRFMGRRAATHTLTILCGTDSPETELYSATFYDSLDYPYTYYQHNLTAPVAAAEGQSLWIVLKCTDVDTPGVFSIYGGNPYGILSGSDLQDRSDDWKFSWMIEALFSGNAGIGNPQMSASNFHIYPNPASNRVSLSGLPTNATVEIIDVSGRKVYASRTIGSDLTVDVSGFTPGTYIVRIATESAVGIQRFVVK